MSFLRLFNEEYDKIKDDASLNLELPDMENKAVDSIDLVPETVDTDAFEKWKQRYVAAQIQDGLYSIKLPLQLGDLIREDGKTLTEFLMHFGDNCIRCDRAQNIRLRNIPEAFLGNAYLVITRFKQTLVDHAPFIGNMINCTGAQTCSWVFVSRGYQPLFVISCRLQTLIWMPFQNFV